VDGRYGRRALGSGRAAASRGEYTARVRIRKV